MWVISSACSVLTQASTKVASASPAGTATTYESYPTNGPSDNLSAQTNGVHESDRSDRDEVPVSQLLATHLLSCHSSLGAMSIWPCPAEDAPCNCHRAVMLAGCRLACCVTHDLAESGESCLVHYY